MFFRIVRAAGGKGVQHEYVRLVESYREHGKPKQRVVCNLGRKDLLVANLDSLNRLLGAGEPADTERAAEQIAGADAWDWGPMVVTATLWRELGLEQILDRLGGRGKRDGVALSERALVLVANRLCAPSSEHGLARWLETDFVCDRQGRRWVPQWRGPLNLVEQSCLAPPMPPRRPKPASPFARQGLDFISYIIPPAGFIPNFGRQVECSLTFLTTFIRCEGSSFPLSS